MKQPMIVNQHPTETVKPQGLQAVREELARRKRRDRRRQEELERQRFLAD
ncbi:MAG: hypothetical protein IT363_00410 [Methanoregulaceae archaeon]|nr:hypothetical protein [Methanoregulaceae archaeon]